MLLQPVSLNNRTTQNDDELDRLDNIIETLNSPQENMEQLVNKVLEDWGFVGLEENNE